MQDIYDIYPPEFGSIISLENMFYFLVILMFLYALYKIIGRKKEEQRVEVKEKIKEIDFLVELENISQEKFLENISKLFRKFLEVEKGYENISTKTLAEILGEEDIEKKYKDFLEKIYLEEYKGREIGEEKREEIITEIKDFFG